MTLQEIRVDYGSSRSLDQRFRAARLCGVTPPSGGPPFACSLVGVFGHKINVGHDLRATYSANRSPMLPVLPRSPHLPPNPPWNAQNSFRRVCYQLCISCYMQPEGPWQRLRRRRSSNSILFALSFSCPRPESLGEGVLGGFLERAEGEDVWAITRYTKPQRSAAVPTIQHQW